MIGRGTTLRIADVAQAIFSRDKGIDRGRWVPWDPVYDFFYGCDFDAQFCNAIKHAASKGERHFTEFILRLHTGETVIAIRGRDVPGAELEGQILLRKMAQALLAHHEQRPVVQSQLAAETLNALEKAGRRTRQPTIDALKAALDLDGYAWVDGLLVHRESAPVDAERQRELLAVRAAELGMGNQEVFTHTLKLSEEAYQNGKWEDCVGNARKSLELVLHECAALYSKRVEGVPLAANNSKQPYLIRDYLRDNGLLDAKEHKALSENYGLLSAVGNHPYIAQGDQARMLRQIALVLAEFVLLRTAGALKAKGK
jgi:hypothetical protein